MKNWTKNSSFLGTKIVIGCINLRFHEYVDQNIGYKLC